MSGYNVVLRGKNGPNKGVTSWTTLPSKEGFDIWFDEDLKSRYEIVEEGVTASRAKELCGRQDATEDDLVSESQLDNKSRFDR